MGISYARVSTTDQNLEIQLNALNEAGCKRIYQEKVSGVQKDRPELKKLINQLRPEDVVVVWKLDRLARSTQPLLDLVEKIRLAEASFRSLSEPWADTTSHAEKMIMTVFAGQPHPLMHKTQTLDYIIILSGQLYLIMEDTETELNPGDIVIQCATNHAWSNRTEQPCIQLAIILDAQKEGWDNDV